MENISILDQIITNQKAEQVAELDAVEIINNLFSELSERERDVIVRRYGLHGSGKETLESIGNAHSLTRERIRQIETTSIAKLQNLENLDNYINTLKKVIFQMLEEHGGLMEKEYLLNLLAVFSLNGFQSKNQDELIHKSYLNFLITKLLYNEFEEVNNIKYFKQSYRLKYQALDHFETITQELLDLLIESKKLYKTNELIELALRGETYNQNKEKINTESALDVSKALRHELFKEDEAMINSNKTIYSILKAAKKIEQNKFGSWGIANWREIKPKTINDKIYLVLKNFGKPLHFAEIADRINKISFDNKKANAATVHNELILDKKYILVGRGIYSLQEWGYKDGTVTDVIVEILDKAEEPLSRDEIISQVLGKRLVKKATIILALMNKNKFSKKDGKYQLDQV